MTSAPRSFLTVLLSLLLILAIAPRFAPAATQLPAIKVMSFNIRVGSADQNTVNKWDNRKGYVAQTIASFAPDIFGLQESLKYQWQYVNDQVPGYKEVGVSVEGNSSGEYVPIFYKTSRFNLITSGNFWLNPTNTPGELGWDAAHVRMVTWVELQDKLNPTLKFVYLNTHWDNEGGTSRLQSANLMRKMIHQIAPTLPVIISGDFNADQGGNSYRRMTGLDNADGYRDYGDTYREIHPGDAGSVSTSLGFDGVGGSTSRIDWILHDAGFTTLDATIDRVSYNGHYPSDHFPITATLRPLPTPEPTTLAFLTLSATPLLLSRKRSRSSH